MKSVIEIKELTKKYGDLTAVNRLTLSIREGEFFGLLGPNGAGKTTLISMLCTLLEPTSGSATVNGAHVVSESDKVRQSIGVVFQDPSLDELLTARENLEFHGRMYGMNEEEILKKSDDVLDLVELSEQSHRQVKTFSGGMRRRLEIARGLMHTPKVLFLDEPTIGLDLQTRNHIWKYLLKLKEKHKMTIVLTTHYMEEAERTCDRIAIIDRSKLVVLGTPSDLKKSIQGNVVRIKTKNGKKELAKKLERVRGVTYVDIYEEGIAVSVTHGSSFQQILKIVSLKKFAVESIETHEPTLDDVFIHYTGKEMRKDEPYSDAKLAWKAGVR
ncbi:ATP-binding cassette domain-containing protein [Candidatus Micrarchaeota archaeon]|nr:ATP-binding cassette domain-containing protein [Candidatus Micrarchaeota archaeon]